MKVKRKVVKDNLYSMKKAIQAIDGKKVNVGVLQGEHQWLAGIHEYGCNITASKAKYLTVPMTAQAAGRKAKSFSNTFVYTSKNGNKFIARSVNGELELLYWLTKSVHIPERSFLRAGFDEHRKEVERKTEKILGLLLNGEMSEERFLRLVGILLKSRIQEYARKLNQPPNHPFTIERKGSSNPLVDTKDMINGIIYEVEG